MLYEVITKRIESPGTDVFITKFSTPITKVAILSKKLLKKTAIPEVKAKEDTIKMPLDEDFWNVDGLTHLEAIRANIRDRNNFV